HIQRNPYGSDEELLRAHSLIRLLAGTDPKPCPIRRVPCKPTLPSQLPRPLRVSFILGPRRLERCEGIHSGPVNRVTLPQGCPRPLRAHWRPSAYHRKPTPHEHIEDRVFPQYLSRHLTHC